MAFIWFVSDRFRKQITHYLQFFPKDGKHQIDKGISAEIMVNYLLMPIDLIGDGEKWMTAEYDISTFRISGENAYIVIENKEGDFGKDYKLRFSEDGYDISIGQDLLHEIQVTCRLIPAHPKDLASDRPGLRAYRLEQRSAPAL